MARKLPELAAEIEARPEPDWARKRLLVVRLIGQHELTAAGIMRALGVRRQTVFTYRAKAVAGGVGGLLHRGWKGPAFRRCAAPWRRSSCAVGGGAVPEAGDARVWIAPGAA